ncbi:cyclic nucleotide-binding domain-containing protein, partial [candidate division KSB3 bacterium]|nr:cyclic nucleotide-binding domain-containing protein [candidate division KSB3 bacterium]MBD3324788.1 cyclic nucleotide-binding domain-containing protein [candidate division KSB3 bacterium]
QGTFPDALYVVETGQVTIQLETKDQKPIRLRTMGPGTIVGELGIYLNRRAAASVIVLHPGTIYRLSRHALQQMQATDPHLAAFFHEFMASLLSERLIHMNTTVQALLEDT